ncbi:MAG: beta-N-acetylhexosaminidase [Armatimonadetes bacterium]|nr:beta-N-acetylhexosaminidase [Armatimonadota bacterium]
MRNTIAAVLLLCALPAAAALGQTPKTYTMNNFDFSYSRSGVNLKYKGVSVIRKSSLYVVSPGWTKLLFGHHLEEHAVTSEDVPGGKLIKVAMRNDVFAATYEVTLLDSDEATIDLRYRLLTDEPAEIEYCLGYFSAPMIADCAFEADTVEGRKSGTVPYAAASSDQRESMLVPPFHRLRIDSRLGPMELTITGDSSDLVIFDARRDHQPWAREAPIFWCGIGVPARPISQGDHRVTARLKFSPREDVKPAPEIRPESVRISDVKDAKLPMDEMIRVVPQPKSMDLTGGDFAVTPETLIVLPDEPTDADRFAAESLNEELREVYGIELRVVSAGQTAAGRGFIAVGEPGRNSLLDRLCRDVGLEAPAQEEGYALKASKPFVLVAGRDVRGTFYGVQTLIQLLKPTVEGAAVTGAVVSDWPSMKVRGAHVFIGNESKPFLQKLIRRIFARNKLNFLLIQADYTKWESDPGIWLDWSTDKKDLKAIVDYARLHHMEVAPLVQSLGHSEWMFKNNSNLDIAEDPEHAYGYCPSNPKSYEYIFRIYDEAVELFRPKWFHIGHDEVTMKGSFPHDDLCKQKTVQQLFNEDVAKLHEYFARKGIRVMLWGDMGLHKTETPDAGWAATPEIAKGIREGMPKDVIVTDWHYCAADDFPSVRLYQDLGHDVIASTWYVPQNIVDFGASAQKDGALGLMQTLWAGYHISEKTLGEQFQQFHAYILAAEFAWGPGGRGLEDLPYTPADQFTRLWNQDPADHAARDGFSIDLSPYVTAALGGETDDAWLGYGPEHDLRAVNTGRQRLLGIEFDIPQGAVMLSGDMNPAGAWPDSIRVPIGRKADSLSFLLAGAFAAEKGQHIGRIMVRYSNVEAMVVDLVYGENIVAWNDSSATPSARTAWMGRTSGGDRIVLRVVDWRNPMPDKPIDSVHLSAAGTECAPVLFALTGLIR